MSRLRWPAGDRLGIVAPMLGLQVLVDMRGVPGGLGVELAEIDGERQQRRARQRRHHVQGGQPQRFVRWLR